MVSKFFYLEKRIDKLKRLGRLDDVIKLNIDSSISDEVTRFRTWLINGGLNIDRSKYFIDGKIGVDFFIRFEHLREDIVKVLDKLDISSSIIEQLPHKKNSGNKKPIQVSKFYDNHSKALIEDLYKWELNYFEYQLP